MCIVSLQERLPFERQIWLFRGEFKWYGSLPEPLTRPQSSLLRKERSARGDGKEERVSPFPFPLSHHPSRFSPFSRETTGDESARARLPLEQFTFEPQEELPAVSGKLFFPLKIVQLHVLRQQRGFYTRL